MAFSEYMYVAWLTHSSSDLIKSNLASIEKIFSDAELVLGTKFAYYYASLKCWQLQKLHLKIENTI